jgi:hypothetical protein
MNCTSWNNTVLLSTGKFRTIHEDSVPLNQPMLRVSAKYPTGALWILNKAKILRMSGDSDGAIQVLRQGLAPDMPHTFAQADMLVSYLRHTV